MADDVRRSMAAKNAARKRGDMGRGSREEFMKAGKGPSQSKQGPKKVSLNKTKTKPDGALPS